MRESFDTLLDGQEVTTGTTQVSEAVPVSTLYGYSVWASWSGTTISGSIKLEASIDGIGWADVVSSPQTINSDDSHLWNEIDVMYRFFRVSVTSASNTITVDSKFSGKGV